MPVSIFSVLRIMKFMLTNIVVTLTVGHVIFTGVFGMLVVSSNTRGTVTDVTDCIVITLTAVFKFRTMKHNSLIM